MSAPHPHRVIGRLRLADGGARPVFEVADGRMYLLADDGTPVFGVWLPPAFEPLADPTAADEAGVPPWERPGAVRRDCEPHRAGFLKAIAVAGLVGAALGIVLFGLLCAGASPSPLLPALAVLYSAACFPCSVYATVAGQTDLGLMRAGRMDPAGWRGTEIAQACGLAGAFAGTLYVLLSAALWLATRG
jgi:hypothetical protein